MRLSISADSSAALREFAEAMPLAVENISVSTKSLFHVYTSVIDLIGPHHEQFKEMLITVKNAQDLAVESIQSLSPMLKTTADKIDRFLARNPSLDGGSTAFGAKIDVSSGSVLPVTGIIGNQEMNDSDLSDRRLSQEQLAYKQLSDYMNAHNYGRNDFNTYSKDPEWVRLHRAAFPQSDIHNNPNAPKIRQQCAFAALSSYISAYNYTRYDQSKYMKDPEWQQIYRDAYPESLLPIQGFIDDINPNFDPYYYDSYHINCGSCALAVEERLSGRNPTAFAGAYNLDWNCNMEAATKGTMVRSSREEIENILRDKGAGSHLIVGINRTKGSGHWFNVFYDGHDVHIIDGQMGEIHDWSYDYGNVSSWEVLKL